MQLPQNCWHRHACVHSISKNFYSCQSSREKCCSDPILPEKGLAMLYASRGTGKTHVALGIGFAVATGTKFLKWTRPETSPRIARRW